MGTSLLIYSFASRTLTPLRPFALRKEIEDKPKKLFNACYKISLWINSTSITFSSYATRPPLPMRHSGYLSPGCRKTFGWSNLTVRGRFCFCYACSLYQKRFEGARSQRSSVLRINSCGNALSSMQGELSLYLEASLPASLWPRELLPFKEVFCIPSLD